MNLFMLVPEINENHTALAHLPKWIRRISKEVDKLYVFTLKFSESTELPNNVEVYCPSRASKLSYFFYINFYILKNVYRSDVIFGLMYPILTIWASPYAKIFRKPIVMWYAHGTVSNQMLRAHNLAKFAVSSSKDGFKVESKKIRIIGQAIDINKFKPKNNGPDINKKILYLGRISKSKNIETLIEAANILVNHEKIANLEFNIIGAVPDKSHLDYYEYLQKLIKSYNLVDHFKFHGIVPYTKVEKTYQNCDIFVNPSSTGSLDKTVLEAMACEKIAITSNNAFYNIFNEKMKKHCFFKHGDYKELAEKIKTNVFYPDEPLKIELRNEVVMNHNLDLWVEKLIGVLKEARGN